MSDSSFNPFASPAVITAGPSFDAGQDAIELRPVSFSGKLSEEEANLLTGRRTLAWADTILFAPVLFALYATIYQVAVYRFNSWPDSSMLMIFLGLVFYSIFIWWLSKSQHMTQWERGITEGTFNRDEINVRTDQGELNLIIAEHVTNISPHGIRIELGRSLPSGRILISRHWFHNDDFQVACETIRRAKSIEVESLQLYSTLCEYPESAIPFYQLNKGQRFRDHLKQIFGFWATAALGFFLVLLAIMTFQAMPNQQEFLIFTPTIVLFTFGVLGILGFLIARACIYFSMLKHPSFDPAKRNLQGWCDPTGITTVTSNGIAKLNWHENQHYAQSVESLTFVCWLLTPRTAIFSPNAFETREEWLEVKSIIKAKIPSMSEIMNRNGPALLKLFRSNKVR